MKVEIGKTYRDGGGDEHYVAGFAVKSRAYRGDPNTAYYDDVVWTHGGNWFYTDGRRHDRPASAHWALKEEA